jgi:acyl-CoA reductase-like NAD-dependent aldehyde dehydrogenase
MKDKDRFDVLNPFNGDIVESVINMSRSQVHEVLGKSLDFQCKLSAENRSEVLLKTAEYLK